VIGAPPGAVPNARDHLLAGWRTALVRAGVAFGAVLGLAVALAVLAALGPSSLPDALRQAGLVPALVHRIPIDAGPVTMRLALLLATAGAGWLLSLGGRAVAREAGGTAVVRAAHGAKVALPYAVAMMAASLVAVGASAGALGSVAVGPGEAVSPSVPGSLAWPFLLAAACGAAGGVAAAPPRLVSERRVRAVLSGGWRATWVAVLLGVAGFLVVMALHPAAVRTYVDAAFRRGPAAGTLVVTGTTLVLPNAGAGVASAAMGGGVEFEALEVSCTVISYTRLPRGAGTTTGPCGRLPFRLGSPSPAYFVFLLLPVAATVSGGWLAARRAGAGSRGDGAPIGAMAGVAFAGLFALLCAAARLTYEATGQAAFLLGEVGVAVGPDPLAGFLLAFAWGCGGGALGGWVAVRLENGDGPGFPRARAGGRPVRPPVGEER
jgi:hypothetical protein